MYGKTDSSIEKKILCVFWSIVFLIGFATVVRVRSVHVLSIRKRNEDNGALVFDIEVTNPTNEDIVAFIDLTTGNLPCDAAYAVGKVDHYLEVMLPAKSTTTVAKRFEWNESALIGPAHSAHVVRTSKVSSSGRVVPNAAF